MPTIKIGGWRFRSRVAAFDFDWTLCRPKSDLTFAKDVNDWTWLRPNVPTIVQELWAKGYCIVIFTNQSRHWTFKREQIETALRELNVPVMAVIAFEKSEKKPSRTMWDAAIGPKKWKPDSFFCGDALGRPGDFAKSDREFAEAIGLTVKTPEELFPIENKDVTTIPIVTIPEAVVIVGPPGSGKSTVAALLKERGYVVIEGDVYKTSAKMLKAASGLSASTVFDATNPSREKRAEYVKWAQERDMPIRCIYLNTSLADSMARNGEREKPVPKIVYAIYKKKFIMPELSEGFSDIVVV